MFFDNLLLGTSLLGYIAGTDNGILTIDGVPSASDIIVFDAKDLSIVLRTQSLKNGHYLVNGLDASKKYLIMARDVNKNDEPMCWDYVTPATDLTIQEQQELWQSWQTQ